MCNVMKRKGSTYGLIFLLLVVTSTVLTCQCGDLGEKYSPKITQSNDCCHPMEKREAQSHPEKDCCGQCFSSETMSVYLHRATFTVNASDVLDVYTVVSQPEERKPYYMHIAVPEEGGSFFISHVFKTAYSSQAPPMA